jgi:cytochrome c-type biogenesis protein CcmH/NrfG
MKQERLEEAFAYATLSYQADPGDAGGLALIARIESQRGHHGYAVEAISKAAEMDATFAAERDRMKEQKP